VKVVLETQPEGSFSKHCMTENFSGEERRAGLGSGVVGIAEMDLCLSHVPVAQSCLSQIPHRRMNAKRLAPRDRFNGVDPSELTHYA
jgi:hypothetical protein